MPRRILVVEDDPDNATVIRMLFDGAGYVVHLARDLAEARANCNRTLPDLAALDACADEFVMKPFDPDRLERTALRHARRRRRTGSVAPPSVQ